MMKRINLFPDYPTHAEQGVPLFEARSPHIPNAFWNSLLDDVREYGTYANTADLFYSEKAIMPDGTPAEQHRIVAQFEYDDGYIFFIDILSLQTTRHRFFGYWAQVDSQVRIYLTPKDFSKLEDVNMTTVNWWWQSQIPPEHTEDTLENVQVDGMTNFQVVDDATLTFRWAPRGLMRVRILPKARLGFRYGYHSTEFVGIVSAIWVSRLRIRRKFEWSWPTSRTFWSLWRGFYDIFLRYAGYVG